jgi:hypothetical protein
LRSEGENDLAKSNYAFKKRQKELDRKKKKELKRQRKHKKNESTSEGLLEKAEAE